MIGKINSPVWTAIINGIYGDRELRAMFGLLCLIVFLLCVLKGRRLRLFAFGIFYWHMLSGVLNVCLDGFYGIFLDRLAVDTLGTAFDSNGRMLIGGDVCRSFFTAFWKTFARADNRLVSGELSFLVIFEALLCGPLSLLAAACMLRNVRLYASLSILVGAIRLAIHTNILAGLPYMDSLVAKLIGLVNVCLQKGLHGAMASIQGISLPWEQLFYVSYHLVVIIMSLISLCVGVAVR